MRHLVIDDDHAMGLRMTRRALVLAGGEALVFGLLGLRLGYLQVAQGRHYAMLAEDNRISMKVLAPLRGLILDRYGVPLADNIRNYRVTITPEQAKPLESVLRTLQWKLGLSEDEVAAVLKAAKRAPSFAALSVRDYLTWPQVATVEVNLPNLPGVAIEEDWARLYPFAEATAHLIGYVGVPAEGDLRANDPLMKLPGFRIGKSAMEKALEKGLRGLPGTSETEVNVVGRAVRELAHEPSVPGERLVLSIDAEVQQQLQTRLAKEKSASAVIMDVQTGEVYALASHPSFDPNQFSRQLTSGLWQELLSDETTPLANKAVAGQYPPGSTFKMVTALAALEAGVINAHTSVFCPGHYQFGRMKFHCWRPEGHGTVNVTRALQQSCDVFFYEIGNRLGIDRIAAMARKLGLGEKLGIELAEEQPGLMPDKDWKRRAKKEPWHPGETINTSIGQGAVLATPLQLATMTSRLVNGGREVKPWLVGYANQRTVHDGEYPLLGFSEQNLKLVIEGMNQVVNVPGGTALGSRLRTPGVAMGGKTGTSQVKRITAAMRAAGVKNENLPWKDRHHALFVAFAPVDAPRYAMAVVVEHGVGGAKAAAPVARDMMEIVLARDPASTKIVREDKGI